MTFGLSGCQLSNVTYSNLVDEKTRNEVAELLVENKLPKKDVKKVMDWVNELNSISKEYSYKKDFVRLPKDGLNYDTLYMDDTAKSHAYLNWLNCRLTPLLRKYKSHCNFRYRCRRKLQRRFVDY